MTIQEYFARLCAAGLIPNFKNLYAIYDKMETATGVDFDWLFKSTEDNEDDFNYFDFIPTLQLEKPNSSLTKAREVIQLRKDGENLFKLEWRKPTERDIGKMCWCWNQREIFLGELDIVTLRLTGNCESFNVLLADHGRIVPTKEDFERVYND